MTRMAQALALLSMLALAACYPPVTSRPVGTTVGLKQDPALLGTWKGTDRDGKASYAHFIPRNEDADTMAVILPVHGSGDVVVAVFSTARFGNGFGYLNARLSQANGEQLPDQPPGTVPVLYRIDAHGTLTLALMDEDAVKAAIAAGKIKGTAGTSTDSDAVITADPKALDSFFASSAPSLFAEPFLTLHKVD